MKKHTAIYFKAFGYDETDFIPSEISGARAIDLHHIVDRSNRIENIMAVTREEHLEYGEIKSKMRFLLAIHLEQLINKGIDFDEKWILDNMAKYEN